MRFKVSLGCREQTDAEGRQLVPGEFMEFSKEQRENDFNQRLIADGHLLGASTAAIRVEREITEEANA